MSSSDSENLQKSVSKGTRLKIKHWMPEILRPSGSTVLKRHEFDMMTNVMLFTNNFLLAYIYTVYTYHSDDFGPFSYPTLFTLHPSHLVTLPSLLAATCPLRGNNTSYQSRALHSSESLACEMNPDRPDRV